MPKKPPSWFDNPRHPMWLLIRQLVVMVPLAMLLALGYHNGWSPEDWKTLIIPAASLGLFDTVKQYFTHKQPVTKDRDDGSEAD